MDIARVLVIALVVVFVLVRRFGGRPVKDQDRLWVLPAILVAVGVGEGGLIAPAHPVLSVVLLAAGIAAACATGLLMGRAMTLWREPDGTLWAKGNRTVLAFFGLSLATRAALALLGYAVGVPVRNGALLVTLASWILAQGLALAARSRRVPATV
ncbi:hypothetical protein GCM10010302_59710 [Streptomyces polychromogenes]|uniref:DUF1453 domain-containing protein n=1 Tax=Streptomyces polychromogenes TaxID=67342 RepID=A0ABN0VP73_9ACTN